MQLVHRQLRRDYDEKDLRSEGLRIFTALDPQVQNAAEHALTDKQGELAKINSELSDRSMMAESRQVELVAVRAQIEELKYRVGDAEKAAMEEQLRVAREERAKLQRDINAIQSQAESSWQTERMENALLRERINDIAAEVAKLAMQLEGPNSAIEAMLAAEPAVPKTPAKPANDVAGTPAVAEGGGTLAERIRALQSHASRARQQGA